MVRNPTILVADDATLLAHAFKKVRSSAALRFVCDGEEAITYLQGHGPYGNRADFRSPNLFVLELCLPDMSGLKLLDWVRRQPSLQRLVVGVLSGVEYGPDIQQALALGATFYFAKPHTYQELLEIARRLTDKCAAGWSTSETSAKPGIDQRVVEHLTGSACGVVAHGLPGRLQ